MIKPLVEEAVHPLGGGIAQAHAKVVIERLQIARLEALEDDFVPDDEGGDQIELVAVVRLSLISNRINDVKTCCCPCFVRLSRQAFS